MRGQQKSSGRGESERTITVIGGDSVREKEGEIQAEGDVRGMRAARRRGRK